MFALHKGEKEESRKKKLIRFSFVFHTVFKLASEFIVSDASPEIKMKCGHKGEWKMKEF